MLTQILQKSVVKGRLVSQWPVGPTTWFQVGGPADWMFRPADVHDLTTFLLHTPQECPILPLGVGSNIIVRDGGVEGCVVKLGRGFTDIQVDAPYIDIGAAALDRTVAEVACSVGLEGLEFLVGIPGTMGGAVRMNAGAYGREIADVLEWVELCDREGYIHRLSAEECGFSYRHSKIPAAWIVVGMRCRGTFSTQEVVSNHMAQLLARKEQSQPTRARTGGSTFKNPPEEKAWLLIDQAGCRGLERGGAMISPMHCNFMLNMGTATAEDLESLGEEVREKVLTSSGILLDWEIKRLGRPTS